ILRPVEQPANLVRHPRRVTHIAAEQVDQHAARADALQYAAGRVMDAPVRGVRGGLLTVAEAKDAADELREQIDHEEVSGSSRHHLSKRFTKWTVWLVVVLIDFPIMLWACSSVFNVDWTDPWGVRLLFSVAAAVLATLASAAALHHLGRELREHKTEGRGLA